MVLVSNATVSIGFRYVIDSNDLRIEAKAFAKPTSARDTWRWVVCLLLNVIVELFVFSVAECIPFFFILPQVIWQKT